MLEASRTAYLFQCEGEDLYAVSHDITGDNIPPVTLHAGLALPRGI